MAKRIKMLLVVTVLLLAGLACALASEVGCYAQGGTWVDGEFKNGERVPSYCIPKETTEQQDPAQQNAADDADPACDATAQLEISYSSPEITIYEDGTSICEYEVLVTNTHDASVWVWVDQHVLEGDSGMDYTQWMGGEHAYSAGYERSYSVTHTTYTNDPDYEGPNASLPVQVAGVYKTDECTPLKDNSTFVEDIAIPLDVFCP